MDEFWVEKFGMNVGESEFEDDRSIVYMEVRSHPLSLTRGTRSIKQTQTPVLSRSSTATPTSTMKPSRTLLALSTLSIAMADQAPCTLRHCGTFIDLNPLSAEYVPHSHHPIWSLGSTCNHVTASYFISALTDSSPTSPFIVLTLLLSP